MKKCIYFFLAVVSLCMWGATGAEAQDLEDFKDADSPVVQAAAAAVNENTVGYSFKTNEDYSGTSKVTLNYYLFYTVTKAAKYYGYADASNVGEVSVAICKGKTLSSPSNVVIPKRVRAPEPTKSGGFNYYHYYNVTSIADRGFTKGTGSSKSQIKYKVPGDDKQYTFTADNAADDSLYSNTGLESVTIPSSVTKIGARAFDGCSSLTSITIPTSVTSIGVNAFANCYGLTKFEFQRTEGGAAGITEIPVRMFYQCVSLKELDLPEGITKIDNYALQMLCSLTRIHLPNTLTTIGGHFLCRAKSLPSIVIPASVTDIDGALFHGCESLRNVYLMGKASTLQTSFQGTDANVLSFTKSDAPIPTKPAWPNCGNVHDCTFWIYEPYYNPTSGSANYPGYATVGKNELGSTYLADLNTAKKDNPWAWLDGYNPDINKADGADYNGYNNKYAFLKSQMTVKTGRWQTAIFFEDTNLNDAFGSSAKWAKFTRAEREEKDDGTDMYYLYFTIQSDKIVPGSTPVMLWVDKEYGGNAAYDQFMNSDQNETKWLTYYGNWHPITLPVYDKNTKAEISDEKVTMIGSAAPAALYLYDFYYVWSQADGGHGYFKSVYDVDKAPKNGTGNFHCFWRVLKDGQPVAAKAKSGIATEFDEPTVIEKVVDETPKAETDTRVFDLSGRYVGNSLDNLPKGVYIRGGKKIMVR